MREAEDGRKLRVLDDLSDEDALPSSIEAWREMQHEQRRLASSGDQHVSHMRNRDIAARRGHHPRKKDIGIVVSAELPSGEEIRLRHAEPGREIEQIAEFEQLGAAVLLCRRLRFHGPECGPATDETGLAFLDEASEFEDGSVRAALAMLTQHRQHPACRFTNFAGTVVGEALQERCVVRA
ncbi:MAG: hypothetical protein J0H00_16850 [Burkholderiales bacterium]|nr:hypothetical protein [Burkholderiales bacterium]